MSKSFEEEYQELKNEFIEMYKENNRQDHPKWVLDGPHARKEKEINQELIRRIANLKKKHGME